MEQTVEKRIVAAKHGAVGMAVALRAAVAARFASSLAAYRATRWRLPGGVY